MTKIQKVWLWIYAGLFVVPEVLWSPVVNFYYQFIKGMHVSNVPPLRNNFLQNIDNTIWLKLVIFIQALGILLLLINIVKYYNPTSRILKALLILILFLLLLAILFALYFALTFSIEIL